MANKPKKKKNFKVDDLKLEVSTEINKETSRTNLTISLKCGEDVIDSKSVSIKEAVCIYSGEC